MNKQHVTLLVFLDLSATFATVDYSILLRRPENNLGISGSALEWFRSYLSCRFQQTCKFDMQFGLPQGSSLGPLLFSIHKLSVWNRKHPPSTHTALPCFYTRRSGATQDSAVATIEAYISDVREWMITDKLKINDDEKTELQPYDWTHMFQKLVKQASFISII